MLNRKIKFVPINIAVLTISDTRTLADDKSGKILVEKLSKAGHILTNRKIVKDSIESITHVLTEWCKNTSVDVIITTGGTGLTGRDVTPEAVIGFFDKPIEGFGELFRYISFKKIGTSALQSRATAGVKNGKYIFCLPGSPSACIDAWDNILLLQLDIRHKPCNFVEILPRLKEYELSRSKK